MQSQYQVAANAEGAVDRRRVATGAKRVAVRNELVLNRRLVFMRIFMVFFEGLIVRCWTLFSALLVSYWTHLKNLAQLRNACIPYV